MGNNTMLIKRINIPQDQRKRTTIASVIYYDTLEIYDNSVVGYLNGQQTMRWYFKDYNGIDVVKANMNSQFGQIVFLNGINSKNRVIGIDFGSTQNINAINDTNRILFCSGIFSFKKTNDFTNLIASDIRTAFESYNNNKDSQKIEKEISPADEIRKFKELLDSGIITHEEFDIKKKQLLGL